MLLQLRIDVGKRHLWNSGAAVQEEQHRQGAVMSSNPNPLLDASKPDWLERINAGWHEDVLRGR